MVYRRIELTPAQQLKGLRETHDRYAALADSLREGGDPLLDHDLQLAKERDARRIAHAYEKSIANSMVRMSALDQTHQVRLPSLGARTWLAFFMVISLLEGGLLLAYFRPAIFQNQPAAPRLAGHRAERIAALPPVTPASPPIAAPPKLAAPPPITIAPKPAAQPQTPPVAAAARPSARPSVSAAPKPAAQPPAPPPIAAPPKPSAPPPAPVSSPPKPVAQPRAPPPVSATPASVAPSAAAQPVAQPQAPQPVIAAPPPAAAAPQPSVQPATPPPVATFVVPAAPPQAAASAPQAIQAVQPPTRLEPVMQTHSLPPYPPIARSLGEEGTTRMRVAISLQGAVTECEIVRTSGSARLDGEACNYVQGHWRWNPPTRNGQPVTATTEVNMVWSLKVRQ